MIIKYLNDGTWNYIDHVKKVEKKVFDSEQLLYEYEESCINRKRIVDLENSESYMNGVELTQEIQKSNKLFIMVSEKIKDEYGNNHSENAVLINNNIAEYGNTYAIVLHVDENKEFDSIILITNQKTYIMNDYGKTIEAIA